MQLEVLKRLVTNPAELLACIGPRKLYCCRSHLAVPEGDSVRLSDDSLHGRRVCHLRKKRQPAKSDVLLVGQRIGIVVRRSPSAIRLV